MTDEKAIVLQRMVLRRQYRAGVFRVVPVAAETVNLELVEYDAQTRATPEEAEARLLEFAKGYQSRVSSENLVFRLTEEWLPVIETA